MPIGSSIQRIGSRMGVTSRSSDRPPAPLPGCGKGTSRHSCPLTSRVLIHLVGVAGELHTIAALTTVVEGTPRHATDIAGLTDGEMDAGT